MFSTWSMKKKIGIFTLVALMYVYCIVMIKTYYMKTQRLQRIAERVGKTEKLMDSVKMAEYNFAQNMEELSNYLCEEDMTSLSICDKGKYKRSGHTVDSINDSYVPEQFGANQTEDLYVGQY